MNEIVDKTLNRAITIQQIPSPTFEEQERARYVLTEFEQEGLVDTEMDGMGNVYGRLPGLDGTLAPVVISAHTDTVFPMDTALHYRVDENTIYGPGIGDNSLGVAGLFALVWELKRDKKQLPGDLWLVANVAEEGLGDLKGMRAVVERFGARVKGYIVLEGMSLGQVYHRALGVKRYKISVHTAGGHAWANFGQPSAIHELAKLITQITSIQFPEGIRSSFNVGVISGGTSINTIAPKAEIQLDLRSETEPGLQFLIQQVEDLVAQPHPDGISIHHEMIGSRPAGEISPDHPLIQMAVGCLERRNIEAQLNIGSTDANIPLSRGFPAVCIGLTYGGGAHTVREHIEIEPMEAGIAQLVDLVRSVYAL